MAQRVKTVIRMQDQANLDPKEVDKFDALANRWWDRESEFKPLHDINPLRLGYIEQRCPLAGKQALDIGCGGGIVAEALAQRGAIVTAIDMAETSLEVARLHLLESGLDIDYRCCTAEQIASDEPGKYDLVTCLEMLEHVPDPASVIDSCARLLKPGGHLFLSTINRNPKAYLLAIVGAEYILQMLQKGTHDYRKFIKPSELASWARPAGLKLRDVTGMTYNPITKRYALGNDTDVNYLMHLVLE